jgi:hypothetical protein
MFTEGSTAERQFITSLGARSPNHWVAVDRNQPQSTSINLNPPQSAAIDRNQPHSPPWARDHPTIGSPHASESTCSSVEASCVRGGSMLSLLASQPRPRQRGGAGREVSSASAGRRHFRRRLEHFRRRLERRLVSPMPALPSEA